MRRDGAMIGVDESANFKGLHFEVMTVKDVVDAPEAKACRPRGRDLLAGSALMEVDIFR